MPPFGKRWMELGWLCLNVANAEMRKEMLVEMTLMAVDIFNSLFVNDWQ